MEKLIMDVNLVYLDVEFPHCCVLELSLKSSIYVSDFWYVGVPCSQLKYFVDFWTQNS